jgi:tetratricopeptide (TPR) repeat protein
VKDTASPLALHLLELKGSVQAHIHGYSQGEELLQQSLDLLEEQQPPDLFFKAKVRAQLGYELLQAERIDEALNMLESAFQQVRSLTLAEMAAMYYELSRQDLGEIIQTELTRYKSLQALWQLAAQARHNELHYMLGHAILRSNREQALIYLTRTLEETPLVPLVQGGAHTHLAMWELAGENMAEARSHAKKAQALLQAVGDNVIVADAFFALGAVEYAQQRYKAGDQQFEAGLAMLERLNAAEELAEQYAHYAQLLENRGDLLRATHYWKKAYQTRQAMKA